MVFICDNCSKMFTFINNLYRHKKNSCNFKGCKREIDDGKRESDDGKRESCDGKREIGDGKREIGDGKRESCDGKREYMKVVGKFGKMKGNKWECLCCKKVMLQQSKSQHSYIACYRYKNGVNICMYCERYYDKTNSRSKHEKQCVLQKTQQLDKQNVYNSDKITVVNNTTNNTTHIVNNITNTNNIVLNQFGVEDWGCLWKLCSNENKDEFEKVKMQLITEGLDGISKLIEMHYFNKDYPKNHTIRKPIKNNDFVEVHIGNNEWEHKTIETALEEIRQSTTMYMRPLIDDIIEHKYDNDVKIKRCTNKMFTEVLVPMKYELCNEYKSKLSNTDPLSIYMSQQNEQIYMRKMKTMLFSFSVKLKSLSEHINCDELH
jgi:hypothetical protein